MAEEFFREVPAEPVREVLEPEAIYSINRVAPDFRIPSISEAARWTPPPEGREEEEIEFSWAGKTARHIGTIVHRWLQRIAEDELRGWDARRVESLRARFGRELERRGVPSSELKAAGHAVATALKNTLADERGRWLLAPHAEALSEYRVRTRDKERMRTLIVDRAFRDTDGTRWVVDYKTSRHEGADREGFLDREGDRYARQLALYASALHKSHLGLYFPLLSGWRQWD